MNDKTPARWTAAVAADDILSALAILSRLPVPVDHDRVGARASRAGWAFPVAGAVLGGLAGLAGWLLLALGVPGGIAAAGALGVLVWTTGGLHEDGLSDCADGFGGGRTPDARLEIMKDSRIGSFGATALVLVLLGRWSGTEAVLLANPVLAMAAVGAASRVPMALVMFAMPLARRDGLAAGVGLVPPFAAGLAVAVAVVFCFLLVGWVGPLMVVTAVASAIPLCVIAWRRIEGYTGDVLGASQQLAELAALATAAALLV